MHGGKCRSWSSSPQATITAICFGFSSSKPTSGCSSTPSQPDTELREFRTVDEVARTFDLSSNLPVVLLSLWSPSVAPEIEIRRIDFDPRRVKNARYRYEPTHGALMQLYLGGAGAQVVTKTHFGHNSVSRAAAWKVADGADWQKLTQVSRKIQNYIRRKLAVDKVPGRPILAEAASLWRSGYLLKEDARSTFHWTAEGLVADG